MFELRAPLSADDRADEERRYKYQQFYDSQIMAAQDSPAYEAVEIVDLKNYSGYRYKERTHFLLMRKRLSR